MNLKLLSLSALAGLSGLITYHISGSQSQVKIGKYSPRVDVSSLQQASMEGRAEYIASIRGNVNTGKVEASDIQNVINQIQRNSSRAGNSIGLEFEFMGPANVGGRTRGLVVDNEDSERIYAASVTGGVYISTNGGNTWTKSWVARTNNLTVLTQTSNGDLYVGSGTDFESGSQKGFSGSAPNASGVGIYKSTDRGATWKLLDATDVAGGAAAFAEVNDIKAHPTDANTLVVASARGVQITQDGGATWTDQAACITGTTPHPSKIVTVDWSNDGSILYVGLSGGTLYAGEDWDQQCGLVNLGRVGTGGRWKLTTSPTVVDKAYAILTNGGLYTNIVSTTDAGVTWTSFDPGIPTSAQHFEMFGDNGQANYDLLFKAIPNQRDAGTDILFAGGVQLWRFDGNWTMAATGASSGGTPDPNRTSVHVDHHICTFDPKNPNNIYFGNDGGVYKSLDNGYTFYDINKGYSVSQFYSIDIASFDYAIGGTQDNGNLFLDPARVGNSDYSRSVFNQGVTNGDGFDAAVSQFVDLKYTSAQFGNMGRGVITTDAGRAGSGACIPYCDQSNFYTNLRLWESQNDITSQDSLIIVNDTLEDNVALGLGTRRTFEGKIEPAQSAAKIVAGSIRIGTLLDQLQYDGNGGFTGNGSGTLDESTWEFSVTFDNAPPNNARINAYYATRYDAGSIITVASQTDDIPIEHVLRTNLEPGDILKIQDPIQSIIAMQVNAKCSLNVSGTQWECAPKQSWFGFGP